MPVQQAVKMRQAAARNKQGGSLGGKQGAPKATKHEDSSSAAVFAAILGKKGKREQQHQPGDAAAKVDVQQQPAAAAAPEDIAAQHPQQGQEEADQPSSRLCIKNLPKYLTSQALRQHFSAKGEVTDVKVMMTKDGHSRQMGFVGFKSVEQATAALKYFDKTFIDACRISIEYARKYKDPLLARPWSKHSEGSSAHDRAVAAGVSKEVDGSMAEAQALAKKLRNKAAGAKQGQDGQKNKNKGVIGELEEADPQLAEFLALMAPRSRAKLWANDELAPTQTLNDLVKAKPQEPESDADMDDMEGSSDDEYQEVGEAAAGGKGKGKGAADGGFGRLGPSQGDDSVDEKSEDGQSEKSDEDEVMETAPDAVVVSGAVSDLEYLKSRMKKWDDDDGDEDDMDVGEGSLNGATAATETAKGSAHSRKQHKQQKGGQDMTGGTSKADKGDDQGGPVAMDLDAADGGDADAQAPHQKEHQAGTATATAVAAAANGAHAPIPDPESAVRATSRLFIRNLAYTATEAELMELGGSYGDVTNAHLVIDRETKRSKGIAYLQFASPDDAVKAYQQLDGYIFQGRLLHVLPAQAPSSGVVAVEAGTHKAGTDTGLEGLQGPGDEQPERNKAGSSYKADLEKKRKENAGNRAAWNALFMRPDTVQEAVAAHYGVSKSELMDTRASGDLAVRVALGEAAIIQQTKAALADAGVNVETLETAAAAGGKSAGERSLARSSTCLLVKNLPFITTEEELQGLFTAYGPVARLVLPPAHTLALLEMCEPQDARSAFKALAYKKYHHVPLYLEWAPKDIFNTPPPKEPLKAVPKAAQPVATQQPTADAVKHADKPVKDHQPPQQAQPAEAMGAEAVADEDEEGSCTIYVKNLAFATTDASLKKHFDKVVSALGGALHSARVSKRKHPTSGEMLSAGFGFVEVDSPQVATAVIKQLQGSTLDHHKLSLQLSKRKADSNAANAAGRTAAGTTGQGAAAGKQTATDSSKGVSTKLVVRNVAFEATRKDIVGLFSPFGHLKSCRLPKKFDGNHRGFAFVEFVTKQEARNAHEGVTGTHLYGRRLVVEYAKEEEGLNELRAKTAAKSRADDADVDRMLEGKDNDAFNGSSQPNSKKRKVA